MKTLGLATLLALGTCTAAAGEGRVLFVCPAGTATCEVAARRFEARSRADGWLLAGRAAVLDQLTEADLALAVMVVSIDAPLYRHWLLSIKRYEAWDDIPSVERDRESAMAAIDERLEALAASFAQGDCAARDYACFMARVATIAEGMTRADVERRLGAPRSAMASTAKDATSGDSSRATLLQWALTDFTQRRPADAADQVQITLVRGRVVSVRTIPQPSP